ncbi:MAG TPA: S8 family peptidase [Thermoanaerobaculia bacterium]|nr:S8 family peptidase [Thermoanaerobaculia bacterium]
MAEKPPSRSRSSRKIRSGEKPFSPDLLDSTVIAIPLLEQFREERTRRAKEKRRGAEPGPELYDVIIDLNLDYHSGRKAAREIAVSLIGQAIASKGTRTGQGVDLAKSENTPQYLFGRLEQEVIREVVRLDQKMWAEQRGVHPHCLYRIWPDFKVKALLTKSVATVKADAARVSFSAQGAGVVWAVMDSGIDGGHIHFQKHENLKLPAPLRHRDFTVLRTETPPEGATDEDKATFRDRVAAESEAEALRDAFGHGSHVAGILAGEVPAEEAKAAGLQYVRRVRDEVGEVNFVPEALATISGVAPKCKLMSLKVLDDSGDGLASNLIAAISVIQEINGYGRRIQIHGVNMSVGYDFDPEWFACGQSPLCVEVDRLVRSGVVVVVAAGNTGYGFADSAFKGTISAGMDLTINDPGNADLAITVGSTHRNMPHIYGVSYFSSKGPTGDGRAKPDLVAPGEKIVSCASGQKRKELQDEGFPCDYREDSGTSMAAPHVSGAIAAFLSIRQEFQGRPEAVKEIFLSTATDLKRERYFQGHGLVDLMRAIQSI